MKLSEEVRTWPTTGTDCEFDFQGYGARIAALEAELAAAKAENERLIWELEAEKYLKNAMQGEVK